MNLKVLVCGAAPNEVNSNAVLREYVGRGFCEVLSNENVLTCSFERSVEAAKQFHPELIIVFGSCMPADCEYTSLRTYCSRNSAILVFWLHDDPYEFDTNYKIYQYADFIFSNDRWSVTHISHPNVFHLPLAADPKAHFRDIKNTMERELFFCGVAFPNRRQIVTDFAKISSEFHVEIFGADWPKELNFCKNTRLSNEILPDYYATSLVTLNMGRNLNLANDRYQLIATTPGPRTFEAAMAGAVQCVYLEGLELSDYFTFGEEILVFDSISELPILINQMRSNPLLRRQISEKSQARAMKDHTYANRAYNLLRCCGFLKTQSLDM